MRINSSSKHAEFLLFKNVCNQSLNRSNKWKSLHLPVTVVQCGDGALFGCCFYLLYLSVIVDGYFKTEI